jgi:hypothetical protein
MELAELTSQAGLQNLKSGYDGSLHDMLSCQPSTRRPKPIATSVPKRSATASTRYLLRGYGQEIVLRTMSHGGDKMLLEV